MENLKNLRFFSFSAQKINAFKAKILKFISTKPLQSLGVLLGILFLLILIGSNMRKPKTRDEVQMVQPKKVEVFYIGEAPKIDIPGKVEKEGVVTIYSQTNGIVSDIFVTEGMYLNKFSPIVNLASNYAGQNASQIQAQIAYLQNENTKETYQVSKDLVQNQIKAANRTNALQDELREISERSKKEAGELIDINENIIDTLYSDLRELEDTNVNGSNDDLILSTNQLLSQFVGANNAAKAQYNQLELENSENSNSARLSTLQKEITLQQLELQNKALDLSLEISNLQLSLAQVNQSFSKPVMPFDGTVEQVFVKQNELVSPGTPLAVIKSNTVNTQIELRASRETALNTSLIIPSYITVLGETYEIYPSYVSSEPVDGTLHSIVYELPEKIAQKVGNNQVAIVEVPIKNADSRNSFINVPIDAIHLTQSSSFVYVVQGDEAVSIQVELGRVVGNYVEITNGLNGDEILILNRNVLDGEKVLYE